MCLYSALTQRSRITDVGSNRPRQIRSRTLYIETTTCTVKFFSSPHRPNVFTLKLQSLEGVRGLTKDVVKPLFELICTFPENIKQVSNYIQFCTTRELFQRREFYGVLPVTMCRIIEVWERKSCSYGIMHVHLYGRNI